MVVVVIGFIFKKCTNWMTNPSNTVPDRNGSTASMTTRLAVKREDAKKDEAPTNISSMSAIATMLNEHRGRIQSLLHNS